MHVCGLKDVSVDGLWIKIAETERGPIWYSFSRDAYYYSRKKGRKADFYTPVKPMVPSFAELAVEVIDGMGADVYIMPYAFCKFAKKALEVTRREARRDFRVYGNCFSQGICDAVTTKRAVEWLAVEQRPHEWVFTAKDVLYYLVASP